MQRLCPLRRAIPQATAQPWFSRVMQVVIPMSSNDRSASPPAPRHTIALVDDDRNILTSVSIGLQAEGFTTRVYADGASALKACLENPPDLAIFDIKMPRMDGLECCSGCAKNRRCR